MKRRALAIVGALGLAVGLAWGCCDGVGQRMFSIKGWGVELMVESKLEAYGLTAEEVAAWETIERVMTEESEAKAAEEAARAGDETQ